MNLTDRILNNRAGEILIMGILFIGLLPLALFFMIYDFVRGKE